MARVARTRLKQKLLWWAALPMFLVGIVLLMLGLDPPSAACSGCATFLMLVLHFDKHPENLKESDPPTD